MEPKLVLYPAFDLVFDKYKKCICADVPATAKPGLTAEKTTLSNNSLKNYWVSSVFNIKPCRKYLPSIQVDRFKLCFAR